MTVAWELKEISEIAEIYNGNSISKKDKEKLYSGIIDGTPYVGTKDVGFDHVIDYDNGVLIPEAKTKDFKTAPADSVLVCSEGGSAGRKVAHNIRDTHFGNKLFAIVPGASAVGKFIYYYTLSAEFQKSFKALMAGVIGGVSLKKFKSIKLPICPKSEQKRIVALLDEAFSGIDSAIANTDKNLANARELFESYLSEIFGREMQGATKTTLAKLCEPKTITYGVIKLGDHISDGVPCLRTSNVRRLWIDTDGMKLISPSLSEQYERTILNGGEVLVNVRGTLGGVAVASTDMKGWNVSREVAVVPVDNHQIDPHYAAYWIATKESQNWLTGVIKGVAYKGINLTDLRELPIYLPDIDRQAKIVSDLNGMALTTRNLVDLYSRKLIALDELKQSLLLKAFSGELTADNNDQMDEEVA